MQFGGDTAQLQRNIAGCAEGFNRRQSTLDALDLTPGNAYLDVGCGGGHLQREMSERLDGKGRVVGLDPSPDQINAAREHCEGLSNIELIEGSATQLPFDPDTFDGVATIQTLDYVADTKAALKEMRRVMKPGARLAIVCVLWDHWRFHGADPALTDLILDAFRAHCPHQMLTLDLPHLLPEAGFTKPASTPIGFYNDTLDPAHFAHWAVQVAASFALGQGVEEDKVRSWVNQIQNAEQERRFGFVSVPVLTTAKAA